MQLKHLLKDILHSEKSRTIALAVTSAFALTTLLYSIDLSLFEAKLYDFRMKVQLSSPEASPIVLVSIDELSIRELEDIAPLNLKYHTALLNSLSALKPKAVGYLIDFGRSSDLSLLTHVEEDQQTFGDAARSLSDSNIPVVIGNSFDVTGESLASGKLSKVPSAIALIHKDRNVFSDDRVTRRALGYVNGAPSFHIKLANMAGLVPEGTVPRGSYHVPEIGADYFYIHYYERPALSLWKRSTSETDQELKTTVFPTYSFVDILKNRIDPEKFKGKIVLVGTMTKDDVNDFAFTPYSKRSYSEPKLAIHANILNTIIDQSSLIEVNRNINFYMTFVVAAFVLAYVVLSSPLNGLIVTVGLAFFLFLLNVIVFKAFGVWFRISETLFSVFLVYYLVVPYRLILEYKRRWDFQRKNEVLTQVEEMKTNFLSLVTHDLKTPVARIQGLTEMVIRNGKQNQLSDREQESLEHILTSTDELNHFISTILELTKVDSDHLTLALETKDVNGLIEKAVQSFSAQTKVQSKNIRVDLEPLFPIKCDPSLITKVLRNIIDNALKYSPTHSEVVVRSREIGDYIEVSVQDQGIGLEEHELNSLFTRFYRAKNDATARVGGTGLGLYLTRYFVEAHRGKVLVQSQKGAGTTVKILLPIDSPFSNSTKAGENVIQVKNTEFFVERKS